MRKPSFFLKTALLALLLSAFSPLLALGTPQTVTERIQAQLSRDRSLAESARNVEISANGATVTLRGDVNSYSERLKIETVVRQTNGVYYVNNQTTVQGQQVGFGK